MSASMGRRDIVVVDDEHGMHERRIHGRHLHQMVETMRAAINGEVTYR